MALGLGFLLSLLCAGPVLAQTPTLEFTAGAGNPAAGTTGSSTANQVITFQNNTDNPTGTTFAAYTPAITTTFSLSNQQYTLPTATLSTGTAVAFGTGSNASGQLANTYAIFPKFNMLGSPTNGLYSSAASTVGTGIDVATNNATEVYVSAEALPATVPANARYRYADLTVTFSQAIVNPILHFSGLGSTSSTNGTNGSFPTGIGFTTELDLQTTGVTLSRLSGSTELSVSNTQILNSATTPGPTSGSGAASGSVLVTTPAAGITTLTFRLYLRPIAAGGTIHSPDNSTHSGDGWLISASTLTPTDVSTTITGPTTAAAGQTVTYTANTTNSGSYLASNNAVTITLPSKPAANMVTIPSTATYNAATGVVTFAAADLAAGATVKNSVSFVAPATPGSVSGVAASSSGTSDTNAANNNGSASNANVTTTVSATGAAGTAANCATAGKDGAAASLTTNPNAYYPSTAAQTLAVNATSIAVGAARGANTSIAPGDLLLIIQMQGADINATNTDSYGDGVAGGAANGTSVTTNFTAGTYEYVTVATTSATVTAAAGGTITLATGLKNSYANAVATSTAGQRTFQVIRVPQYTNVTLGANIVPSAWNGATGGIVAIDVDGQLNLAGFTIDASGMGFRGGAGRQLGGDTSNPITTTGTDYRSSAGLNTGGTKGEGIAGTPRYVNDPAYATANSVLLDTRTATTGYPTLLPAGLADGYPSGDNGRGAPGNAGGGGTDANPSTNNQNTGGGGGANGGTAGRGGNAWSSNSAVGGEPGAAFSAVSSSRLVLGGGGGAGATNDGTGTPATGFASSGAAGGGVVLVRTGTLTGTGSVLANGADANNTVANDGSGGGGAGGSILVTVTNSQSATLTLKANGGAGGTNTGGVSNSSPHGPGGGGGGGVILTNSTVAATATVNGGANGNTTSANSFGSTTGANGVTNTSISNSIANSTAGANCIADVATTITGPANANAGSTVSLSVTYSNIGAQTAAGVTRTVSLPAGVINPVATGATISGNVATGYTITYPATSLNSSDTNTYTITYTAPGSGPVVATSNISANPNNEGGLTANNTSSVSTAIGLIADVTTDLTGPSTLVAGQPTGTYTATFTNEGPSPAATVTRTVTLPAGATNILVNGAAYTPTTANPNTIDFGQANTLASGASNAFTFSFTPAANATGNLAITSNVTTATSQGNDVAPNSSTINATVAPTADVATTITANTNPVAAGTLATASGAAKFTVTFSNNGPTTANGVTGTVQLPAGLTNVNVAFPNGANGVSGTYNSTTGVVTYSGATAIPSGGSITSAITFDAPASGPVAATSTITTTTNEAGSTANNTASATINISPTFDLTTTLSGPTSAVAGDLVTLAVTTTNNGPSASPNAVQTVQLPQGLTNVYVSNGGVYNSTSTAQNITVNGVTYANVSPGQVVFPTIANLPSGQTVTNSVSFSQPGTAYSPSALVSTTTAGESNTANNTAYLNGATSSTSLTVLTPVAGTANVYTTITSSVPSTTVGGSVTLTVVTGNNGPNAATGVTQTVQLLPGLTNAGGTVTISNGGTYNNTTGLVTFPTLANGTSTTVSNGSTSGTSVSNTITFNAPASTGNNGQLLAMAAVSTTNTDPVAADNVASVGVTLIQSADLASTVTGPTSAQAGQPVTYTARFINNGPMAATNVVETVQLPTGLGANAVTITDGNGNPVTNATYNSTTGVVTFTTLGTDLNGAAQVYNLTFAAPAQNLTVRSNVTSATTDPALANNSATATTTITGTADLATTVAGPATAVVGSAVTYSVTTTNNGPATATNAATTLQLATGFTTATLQVGGQTGTLSGNVITYGSGATASTYNTTTGLVTFPTVASQASGATTTNYVTFVMPNATGGQTTGVASVSSATTDPASGNNTASIATSIAPTTTTSADITAAVTTTAPAGGVAPGATIAFTATYGNNGTDPAVNVVPTLQLAPGLTTTTITVAGQAGTLSNGLITFPNNAVYSVQSGVVTFPTIASQASGTANNVSYAVNVTAPGNGTVTAVAATTSNTSEPNTAAAQANDVASTSVSITPSFDEVTSLSGPVSVPVSTSANNSPVTYTVTTTNNGPSLTTGTTTQTVTLPAGVTATNISNSGTQSGTTITWTIPAGQAAGTNGAVANTFTILQPAGGATLTANVTSPGESNTGNNTAYLNGATVATATTVTNLAPLAYAVVNTLQGPQSNDAGGQANGLLISPLAASDPENSFATQKYTIMAAPDASQGTLYYNSTGTTYVAVASGQTLTDAQSKTLKFKAASGYVGNASFTYLTTDAVGNPSPTVNYTLPIESDTEAPAYTVLLAKTTAYANGDVLAYTTDVNGAVNNATSASVYQTNGTLQTGANNGVTSAAAGTFTSSRSDVTSLTDLGITLDSNGRLIVTNAGTVATPNLRAGNYSVVVTTTDANGGITTQTVAFTIKANPLPVVLTAFTAQAVQNRDALLNWATASEQNSASFEVERSLDGSTFTKIGQVAAQGTSTSASAYTFTDASIGARAQGSVYYRLRQLDLNGTAYYSPVRTVSFTKAAAVALSVYPNPATTSTVLDLSALPASASYQVLVLDATGRQVLAAAQAGGLPQPLDLTSLASGTYNVLVTGKLADGSALRQTLRLIKE